MRLTFSPVAILAVEQANLNLSIEEVYFGKAKDVVGELRSKSHSLPMLSIMLTIFLGLAPLSETNRDRAAHLEMIKSMQR